jgi:hypothetical protein
MGKRKRENEEKKLRKKEKRNRKRKRKKKEIKKGRKRFRKLGELLGKLGGRILRGFPVFGCQRDFRDGGDGEADWSAGPRRARDSRRGGRPRCWGGTRWAMARVLWMATGTNYPCAHGHGCGSELVPAGEKLAGIKMLYPCP